MRIKYRGWVADVDVESTRRAYEQGWPGASVDCGCADCANFVAARDAGYIYPDEVVKLLQDMGVDPSRESEVYVEAQDRKSVVYRGWFNIAGRLLTDACGPTEIEPGFELHALPEGAVVDDAFGERPVFRIEFTVVAPRMASLKAKS